MNYLAHAYLSLGQDDILVGNMIGDFVKGKKKNLFPERIKNGIELHWAIDTFTDSHPIILETKKIFQPIVRLYAGSFLDISMDYTLSHSNEFTPANGWRQFCDQVYHTMQINRDLIPEKGLTMFEHMIQDDWLYNYQFGWRIEKSFKGLAQMAKYLPDEVEVFSIFDKNKAYLQDAFERFFPQLKAFAIEFLTSKNIK